MQSKQAKRTMLVCLATWVALTLGVQEAVSERHRRSMLDERDVPLAARRTPAGREASRRMDEGYESSMLASTFVSALGSLTIALSFRRWIDGPGETFG